MLELGHRCPPEGLLRPFGDSICVGGLTGARAKLAIRTKGGHRQLCPHLVTGNTYVSELPTTHSLAPAEYLLHPLPYALANGVARMPVVRPSIGVCFFWATRGVTPRPRQAFTKSAVEHTRIVDTSVSPIPSYNVPSVTGSPSIKPRSRRAPTQMMRRAFAFTSRSCVVQPSFRTISEYQVTSTI